MENKDENFVVDDTVKEGEEEVKKPYLNFETARRFASSVRNDLCKNAVIEVVEAGEMMVKKPSGTEVSEMNYEIRGDGCRNQRRNGSAFCQDCSDKFKEENNENKENNDK